MYANYLVLLYPHFMKVYNLYMGSLSVFVLARECLGEKKPGLNRKDTQHEWNEVYKHLIIVALVEHDFMHTYFLQ